MDNFKAISTLDVNKIKQGNKLLHRAVSALQWVKADYFQGMDDEGRLELFKNNTSFKNFVNQLSGYATIQGVENAQSNHYVSQFNLQTELQILADAAKVAGYPNKIYHEVLINHLQIQAGEIKKIKKILSNYFQLSDARVDQNRKKYFLVNSRELFWEPYILLQNFYKKEDSFY